MENKILEKNNIKPPVEGRCGYFVKRKQRYCKMLPSKGNKYCAEHQQYDENQVKDHCLPSLIFYCEKFNYFLS